MKVNSPFLLKIVSPHIIGFSANLQLNDDQNHKFATKMANIA